MSGVMSVNPATAHIGSHTALTSTPSALNHRSARAWFQLVVPTSPIPVPILPVGHIVPAVDKSSEKVLAWLYFVSFVFNASTGYLAFSTLTNESRIWSWTGLAYLPQSTEKRRVLETPVGARHKCQRGLNGARDDPADEYIPTGDEDV
ncbi:hypothetical protein F511_13181 [Dorcoceras hygrometricum]|uniref:Uncharacterized protein n=1 Tax=Dorcoceras hygrometricum TaxID=472368 RepID=A0A2Z7BN41_9LAMI|nr:hypothetical protein F511_13181 [Dorcoceras hygrometricum]